MGNVCHASQSKYRNLLKTITFLIEKQEENHQSHLVQRKSDFSNLKDFKIDPSIFVSLKKGAISSFYKIGEVLGEGTKKSINKKKRKIALLLISCFSLKISLRFIFFIFIRSIWEGFTCL